MKEKDYQEFLEKESLCWTVLYGDHVYILELTRVKKRYVFKVLVIPQKKISFKKKRLEADDEFVYQGKDREKVKNQMMQARIFKKAAFQDIYQDVEIIDKGY